MKCKIEDIVEVTMGQSPKSQYYNTEEIKISGNMNQIFFEVSGD